MGEVISVTVLGARGTAPVEGDAYTRYGGGTVCLLLRMGGETIVLDAGSGLLDLHRVLRPGEHTINLLLSHPHLDHMLGIPSCGVFYDTERLVHIYAAPRDGLTPREQLERLMSPPLWPVGPDAFQAAVTYHAIEEDFSLGAVRVRMIGGAHPGGSTVFRLEWGGVSVVYASDYELDEDSEPKLRAFAQDSTLLLCDGQYSDSEFEHKRGFGHSTWRAAGRLAAACGAKRLLVLHHAPWRGDEEMDAATGPLSQLFPGGTFARAGEEIYL